ncbi:MAG: hypothetical protein ACRYGA_05645 [Janthinobacterium lividum]
MNPQWNTPPDGDFASYVERLSAQSATARRTSQAEGEHSLEGGPTHVPAVAPYRGDALPQQGAVIGPAWGRTPSGTAAKPMAPGSSPVPFRIARIAAAAWVLALVTLIGAGASAGLVTALVLGGLWAAVGLRKWALPQGHASWRGWLQGTVATLAQQQRDKIAKTKSR